VTGSHTSGYIFKCFNRGCRRTTAGRGANHCLRDITGADEESLIHGETRGRTAGTQAPPSTRPRSTCCPPPPPTATDAAARHRIAHARSAARALARRRIQHTEQSVPSTPRAPVVPRPLILQPATDRSDRGRSCVPVRVSRRTSVSVRNNYIVFRTLARATTRGG